MVHKSVKITFTWTRHCLTEKDSVPFSLQTPSLSMLLTLFCSSGCLHGNKSLLSQLLISSCCLPFPNRRQTLQRACFHANCPGCRRTWTALRGGVPAPMTRTSHALKNTSALRWWKLHCARGSVHFQSTFYGKQVSYVEKIHLTDATSTTSQEKPC